MAKSEAKQYPKITAIRDFVWVTPDEEEVSGRIVIPDNAKDPNNPRSGRVIAVGCGLVEGGQIIPLKVKVGDHIFFPRNSGTLLKNDPDIGRTVFVLRENQIFGTVE